MAINSTLAIRVELESGSPDGARGAELLTTETFFFTWETHEFERNRMLHKRLEKMIFRNEHNQDSPIELSKADFHMWQFDPLNPHDMTVRGQSSSIFSVYLISIFRSTSYSEKELPWTCDPDNSFRRSLSHIPHYIQAPVGQPIRQIVVRWPE